MNLAESAENAKECEGDNELFAFSFFACSAALRETWTTHGETTRTVAAHKIAGRNDRL